MKDFDTIYKELKSTYPIDKKYIDEKKIKNEKVVLILSLLTFLSFTIFYMLFFFLIMFVLSNTELIKNIILMFFLVILGAFLILAPIVLCIIGIKMELRNNKQNSTYKKQYNKDILSTLVKEYNQNLTFTDSKSIRKNFYDNADFENYDKYISENYIYGTIDDIINITMGNIYTYDVSSKEPDTIDFEGFFSILQLPKNINCTIKFRIDNIGSKHSSDETLMSMDSHEFEKYFNIYTNNRLVAMQIFTADIMNNFISLRTNNNLVFDFTIKNNLLYTRVHFPHMLYLDILSNSTDYNTLKQYYDSLHFTCTLNKMIYQIINEKNL